MKELVVRTVSGIAFLVIMVVGLLFPPLFPFLAAFVMAVCMHEFFEMGIGKGMLMQERIFAILAALCVLAIVTLHYVDGLQISYVAFALLPLMWIMLRQVFVEEERHLDKLAYVFTGFCYIGIPMALVPVVYYPCDGFRGALLLSLFIIIWSGDVGAYCVGTALGQKPTSKKLAPSISPKKSWWGFAGELIFGGAAAIVLHYIGWLAFPLVHCIAAGILVAACAVMGDLVESIWKRYFGVKDSGNIMPGHGGLLDRFDSSLVAIPIAGIYLTCFGLL